MRQFEGLYPKQNKKKDKFADLNPKSIDPKFKWHNYIYTFVKEFNMQMSDVYNMNYVSSLNWLSFFEE